MARKRLYRMPMQILVRAEDEGQAREKLYHAATGLSSVLRAAQDPRKRPLLDLSYSTAEIERVPDRRPRR